MPPEVKRLVKATRSLDLALSKYNPNWQSQPRVPAGSSNGGRWTDGGGTDSPDTIVTTTTGRITITDTQHSLTTIENTAPDSTDKYYSAWKKHPNAAMREFIAEREKPGVTRLIHHGYPLYHGTLNSKRNIALGRYQLRNISLQDIGLKDNAGKWRTDTKFYQKYKIRMDRDFLNNPEAQEVAMTAYLARQEEIAKSLFPKYEGYTYIGIIGEKIHVSKAGIVSAVHRSGASPVRRYLSIVKKRGGTGNLTYDELINLDPYYRKLSKIAKKNARPQFGNIETRLRTGQAIPYTSQKWPAIIPKPRWRR